MFWDPSGLRMKIDDDSRTSKGNVSTDEIQTVVDSMNILLCGEANIFIDRYGVLHLRDVVEGASGAGYRLIKELIDAQDTFNIGIVNEKTANIYKTSIAETSKYNNTKKLIKFNPNVYSNAVVGFDNVVTVNGKPLYGNMVHEKVTDIEKRKAVSLGHELVHALRDKRGLYFADGETTTYSGTRPIIGRKFWSKAPIIASDEIIKEEFMTVGLIEWNGGNNGRITENDLRRQLGMPLRHWY